MNAKDKNIENNKKPFRLLPFLSQSSLVRIFIIVQLALLAWQFTPDLSTNGDDARYYLLGKALHDGKGFHQIQHPTNPVETTYPIVFPLLLSFVHVFSGSILLAKIVQSILGSLVTLLVFYLFRIYSKNLLLPLVALCAMCATLAQFSTSLMSEIPYLFFSLLALYLYEQSVQRPKNRWLFWLTIVLSVFPMHCRSVGLAFSGSWLLANLLTKRYRYMVAHAIVLAVTIVLFHLATTWDNGYLIQIVQRNTYNPEAGLVTAGEMVQRIMQNIQAYGSYILQRSLVPLLPQTSKGVSAIITAACLISVLAGWVRSLFGPMKFLSLYVFMYFGIFLMWQTQWSSERFVAGVIPFLYFFFLFGLEGFIGLAFGGQGAHSAPFKQRLKTLAMAPEQKAGVRQVFIWAAAILIIIANVSFQTSFARKTQEFGGDWKNFYSCADWIRTNTPPDAVVMNRKVELFYIRSKHSGVMYPYSRDVNKIMKEIDSSKVEYVIFDNFAWTGTTREYLYPAINNFQDRFQMVYALNNPPTAIYKVIR
jgi:hypothetical protein